MNASTKLLRAYAQAIGATKDKDVAERLRVKHSTIANWKAGRAHPDAESIEKMAIAIGEPPGPWLAQIEAARARTPEGRQVWLRLASSLGVTLALAVTALPLQATAKNNTSEPVYCVKLWRRLGRAIKNALTGYTVAPATP